MYKTTIKVTAVFVVLLMLSPVIVFGEGSCGAGPGTQGKMFKRMSRSLDLSQEQETMMKENFMDSKEARHNIKTEIREAKQLLHEELKKPDPSSDIIDGLVEKLKEANGKAVENRVNSIIRAKEILNEDQYEQFLNNMEKKHMMGKKRSFNKRKHDRR